MIYSPFHLLTILSFPCIISLNDHSVRRIPPVEEQKRTRRREQAQESRQRLLDAALQLFAGKGYSETSVHALCASLGVADSLLYHYFPGGKKELMQTLVDEHMLQVVGELNALNHALDDLPIEDVLEKLYQTIRAAVLRHKDLFRLYMQEQAIRELVAYEHFLGKITARQQWFLDLLRIRAERGEIQPMDYESAAEVLDSIMLSHLAMEILGAPLHPALGQDAHRKQLIAYQVSLWKRNQAIENKDQI